MEYVACSRVYSVCSLQNFGLEEKEKVKFELRSLSKIYVNHTKMMLLKSKKYDVWLALQKAFYFRHLQNDGCCVVNPYEEYLSYPTQFTGLELVLCRRLFDMRRARILRLKKRITSILMNHACLFLRLSFTDTVLSSTSQKTRRTYVSRWLKSLGCPFYVANIDFGDKEKNPDSKEREHYHAIVQCSHVDMSTYKYGYMFVQKLRYDKSSLERVTKYINKLSYHAFKGSTGQYRLIYSKPVKSSNSLLKLNYDNNQFFIKNI